MVSSFFALLLVVFVCMKKILRIKAALTTTTSNVDSWKGKEALSAVREEKNKQKTTNEVKKSIRVEK